MSKKTAIVTGATSGVGRVLATSLASQDYLVCGLGRDQKKLREIEQTGTGQIQAFSCDIAKASEVSHVIGRIIDKFERIDLLVNNAATFEMRNFEDQSVHAIDRIIDTNLKGLMYVTHYALPGLFKADHAHIINIASVAGTHGIPQQSIYCASKHGVVGFADVLAQELVGRGIKVTTLCPGGTKTPLWNSETNPYPGDEQNLMEPTEIADLVSFILKQPANTLHKKLVFFPTTEWH